MPVNLPRHSTSDSPTKFLAMDRRKSPKNLMCSSVPACPLVVVRTAGVLVDDSVEVPMIAHPNDMHREEDTTTVAGRYSVDERSSRIAAHGRPVPYAVSYPAEGRHRVGLGRRPFLDGRIRASIRWNSPKKNLFSTIEVGRDDASSGPSAWRDFSRVGSSCLGVPRYGRTRAGDLGMCSAATVAPEAFSLLRPRPTVLLRGAVQALTRHHSSASFPPHL